jgi:hypothetical protein
VHSLFKQHLIQNGTKITLTVLDIVSTHTHTHTHTHIHIHTHTHTNVCRYFFFSHSEEEPINWKLSAIITVTVGDS